MYLVGQLGYQRMVHWPIAQSLPMQPLFCARNLGILHLWFCQIVPLALPSALFDVEQTFARSHHRFSDDAQQIATREAGTCPHQGTAEACI
jgi:hypothetical protein